MEGASRDASEMFNSLQKNFISCILSFTSPRDTCRFATLSSLFRSVAESDQVWEQFIPSKYYDMLSRANVPDPIHFSSKKDLFFRLCDPIIIDGGKNSIALDKTTGKICYMISAKELVIHRDWEYPTLPESRFTNVGQERPHKRRLPRRRFFFDEKFHVEAKLRTAELSENTTYVVYLVYKLNLPNTNSCSLDSIPHTYIRVGVVKEDIPYDNYKYAESCLISKEYTHQGSKHLIKYLSKFHFQKKESQRRGSLRYFPKEREGGHWTEVALGEFFNENGVGGENVFVNFRWWNIVDLDFFIIEGIEFRPKI